MDMVVVAGLALSFATLVTTHLAIGIRMIVKVRPRYRGVIAIFVPPLAPVWAYGEKWRRSCWLWVCSVAIYALFLLLAQI